MIHEKLSHLSPEQVQELVDRYRFGDESVSALLEEYAIDVRPSKLVSILPPQVLDQECPYCEGEHLVLKVKSRTGYDYGVNNGLCLVCGHGEGRPCRCRNCRQKVESVISAQKDLKIKAIRQASSPGTFELDPKHWPFDIALYVLALSRHSLSHDYETVEPYDHTPIPFAPTEAASGEIAISLYHNHHIGIHPGSPTDAFTFTEDFTAVHRFYPEKVKWRFQPSVSPELRRSILTELERTFKDGDWPEPWFSEIDNIWRFVVRKECLEYFFHLMEQRDFDVSSVDERIEDIIDRALDHFAPAQVHNLLWQSARDCVDFIATRGIPDRQAQAVCRGILDRKIDKHVAEGWTPRHSRRDFSCPQSALSSTLFNSVLAIGADAFDQKPPKKSE